MTPLELRDFALTQLAAQANLQVWDGEPGTGKSLGFRPGETEVAMDGDDRAHMHAALYVGSGTDSTEDARSIGYGGTRVSTFQVTAVGGDRDRCLRAVQKVEAALHRKLAPSGGVILLDFDPSPPREDRDPAPPRYFVPLPFRVALG